MTTRIAKLALAAVLAGALPGAAAADDCEHEHRHDRAADHRPAHWQHVPPAPYVGWRTSWRERELASVRAELRALDAARADYHARFAHRPGKLHRYDRAYLERRAALERRWWELQQHRVAWR